MPDSTTLRVLVLANQTLGGAKLIEAVRGRAAEARGQGRSARFFLVVPEAQPRHGNVIYDDAVRDAAAMRVELALGFLRHEDFEVSGEVGDPDPYLAAMDAIAEHQPVEVVVSTLPATNSGWLRRDLPERIADASGLPVNHVVVDVEREGLPFTVTLVVANQTVASKELVSRLEQKAGDGEQHVFVAVVPQPHGQGHGTAQARSRLTEMLTQLREAGLVCAGMIGDPDPYTAAMNALQLFTVDEVVISTFEGTRSGWLRADLVERVRRSTTATVEHVVVAQREPAPAGT